MTTQIRVEWRELRVEHGNCVLYFLVADETSDGWTIVERDAWETVPHVVSTKIAERCTRVGGYAKARFLSGIGLPEATMGVSICADSGRFTIEEVPDSLLGTPPDGTPEVVHVRFDSCHQLNIYAETYDKAFKMAA